jgi:hypothetical protein
MQVFDDRFQAESGWNRNKFGQLMRMVGYFKENCQ